MWSNENKLPVHCLSLAFHCRVQQPFEHGPAQPSQCPRRSPAGRPRKVLRSPPPRLVARARVADKRLLSPSSIALSIARALSLTHSHAHSNPRSQCSSEMCPQAARDAQQVPLHCLLPFHCRFSLPFRCRFSPPKVPFRCRFSPPISLCLLARTRPRRRLVDAVRATPSRRRDYHSPAPPSTFSRCFNSDGEGAWAE